MFRTLIKQNKHIVYTLIGVYALRLWGLFVILPFLRCYVYEMSDFRISSWIAGLIMGGYGIIQALLHFPYGVLSDYWGRKPLLLVGLSCFTAGCLVCAWKSSVEWFLVGRLLQGLGAVGSVLMAALMDVTITSERPRAMGLLGLMIGGSFILALVTSPLLVSTLGERNLFYVIAALGGIAILLVSHTQFPTFRSQAPRLRLLALRQLPPEVWLSILGVGVVHYVLAAIFLWVPLIVAKDYEKGSLSLFYGSILLGSLGLAWPILKKRRVWDKLQLEEVVLRAIALFLLVQVIFLWAEFRLGILIASLVLFFTNFNILEALLPVWLSAHIPPERKGTVLGLYSTIQFAGMGLSGCLGAWLDSQYGMMGIKVSCLLVTGCWFACAYLNRKIHATVEG